MRVTKQLRPNLPDKVTLETSNNKNISTDNGIMHCDNMNTTDKEELLSTAAQPPAYETVKIPSQQQQQQQFPPKVIVNNTTVIHPTHQVPIISLPVELRGENRFCSGTLKAVRRVFIR